MTALALAALLLAAPADAPVWVFSATVIAGSAPAVQLTTTSRPYATEDACDVARNAWLREQDAVTIVELGQCRPVTRVVRRGM